MLKPEHPRAVSGYVYEHVLIAEKHLGRFLKWYSQGNGKNEIVHHKNENRSDNAIENLQVMTHSEHMKLHNKLRRERKNESIKN